VLSGTAPGDQAKRGVRENPEPQSARVTMSCGSPQAITESMRRPAKTIELQPWSYPGHPRVLIEQADPDDALELAVAIRRVGCTVGICCGPDANAAPATLCPLHGLEPCVAVEGADLVVSALDLARQDGREVLQGLRTRYPTTPLVVAATPEQSLELAELLQGCSVVPVDAEPEHVAATVLAALPDRG
jgi:hypothetical protein